ncbi:helix-turn-helix domain-containing protein [Parvibaculum sp.]|jgi:excisionase family DNA binding protein|uniref:helix-turn-helix domain-containing protein n=1 Tax=Parvibaculum sp. TaxID=2024848 RepID=UPI001B18075A|nr:helix-turn-helix domain-containing protein [Parvibaculum sp.]MBO6635444.1 helix-turn-helix domain-containing protein [Parvibaculum sp.]MBO6678702.1 helix-turn-helix domain-containing protein [Parvibaculum sp.]MBO6683938.1 helix-turn-helix domain-containing protein [Parvibaculum sp.]MBO6906373.1 helix-turn-helix domain-containing protein [Parvibaculum sp.]
MSERLFTVEEAAGRLNLHPKTLRRHIREGRLKATRIGKAYRIAASALDDFAGVARGAAEAGAEARATCIVDLPGLDAAAAERLASFLHSAALTGDAETPPLHLQTAFDPEAETMKVIAIGAPADIGRLMEMLHVQMKARR